MTRQEGKMASDEHYCFVCDQMENHTSDNEERACCILFCEVCKAMDPPDELAHGISFGF